jgi:hypothetical protein
LVLKNFLQEKAVEATKQKEEKWKKPKPEFDIHLASNPD